MLSLEGGFVDIESKAVGTTIVKSWVASYVVSTKFKWRVYDDVGVSFAKRSGCGRADRW